MIREEKEFLLDRALELVRANAGNITLVEATKQVQAAFDSLDALPTTAKGHLSAAFLILDRKSHPSVSLRNAKECVGKAHVELVRYKNLYGETL